MDVEIINSLIKHNFEYVSKLGEGAFGTVIKVKHNISNQFFAIKKLNSNRNVENEDILREIQAIAQFSNPNVISYKHSFVENNELYLVMEYCPKGSLRDWLSQVGKLNIEYAVDVFLRLTHTFAFLHNKGYIHHDIKPDNLLFTEDKIKISDFGTVNTSIGTIAYSAPEMLTGDAPVDDVRIDIFSLGITFMECVTGKNPFIPWESYTGQNLIVKNANFPISKLPYWLQQLLLKACHFDASTRFQTMMEFHEAIKKRHIPQIITKELIHSGKLTNVLKMHIVARRWSHAEKFIHAYDDKSINFLIQKGKYYLGINKLEMAKKVFEDVLIKNRNASIEKNIAEIYLRLDEPSKAASILHGYINNHFTDTEAHNQLLHSYFLSDQWELGLSQVKYLVKLFPKEIIFLNNRTIFELLLNKKVSRTNHLHEQNIIGYYNYHEVIKNNNPRAYSTKKMKSLKSKLLFSEVKFKNIYKSKNTIAVEIDNEIHHCDKHIISFGRKGFDYNTFSSFDDNLISRRHFVIINQKNNVWLYDMSSFGTFVDGNKVKRNTFLLGRHEVSFGNQQIIIRSEAEKFI